MSATSAPTSATTSDGPAETVSRLAFYVGAARRQGKSDAEIHADLVGYGLDAAVATRILALAPDLAATTPRRSGTGDIVLGLVLLLLGIIITAATYSAASKSGGHYVVMTGLIAVGLIRLVKGLMAR